MSRRPTVRPKRYSNDENTCEYGDGENQEPRATANATQQGPPRKRRTFSLNEGVLRSPLGTQDEEAGGFGASAIPAVLDSCARMHACVHRVHPGSSAHSHAPLPATNTCTLPQPAEAAQGLAREQAQAQALAASTKAASTPSPTRPGRGGRRRTCRTWSARYAH